MSSNKLIISANNALHFEDFHKNVLILKVVTKIIWSQLSKMSINNLNNEIAMLQIKSLDLKEKFKQKFGDTPYYRKLRIEYFITEIVIILLIGGFAYMLFCVILRKAEK